MIDEHFSDLACRDSEEVSSVLNPFQSVVGKRLTLKSLTNIVGSIELSFFGFIRFAMS